MKKKKTNLLVELQKSYDRWNSIYENGGSDPTWSDGVNLALLRNHIIFWKKQIEKEEPVLMDNEAYLRPLPPEISKDYMAHPDAIRADAAKALHSYKENEDYMFLTRVSSYLSKKEKAEVHYDAVLNYVCGLEQAIAEDDLVYQRHHKTQFATHAFQVCRERVERIATENSQCLLRQRPGSNQLCWF